MFSFILSLPLQHVPAYQATDREDKINSKTGLHGAVSTVCYTLYFNTVVCMFYAIYEQYFKKCLQMPLHKNSGSNCNLYFRHYYSQPSRFGAEGTGRKLQH